MEEAKDAERRLWRHYRTRLTNAEWLTMRFRIERLAVLRGVAIPTVVRHVLWQGLDYWEQQRKEQGDAEQE